MKVKHLTHKQDEWFDVIDSDLDTDLETGKYIGISDMLKLGDGRWYLQNECVYLTKDGQVMPCV